jgi:hypothetical protein
MRHLMLCVLLLVVAGCGNKGGPSGDRDTHYKAFAATFGDLIMKEDYRGAYDMCSSHLKNKMNYDKFLGAHKEAIKVYGKPAKLDTGINFTKTELLSDHEGFSGAPAEIRQARVFAYFGTEKHTEARDGWCLGLDVVQEDGKDLVAAFDYSINH